MMILGPLVAPVTSTVTLALSRPVAVTFSPSTTMTTGRVMVSPAATSVLSISMTSPTATFCCLLPARTIAYTATLLVRTAETSVCARHRLKFGRVRRVAGAQGSVCRTPRVKTTGSGGDRAKRGPATPSAGSALARALLLDRDVLHRRRLGHGLLDGQCPDAGLDGHGARLDQPGVGQPSCSGRRRRRVEERRGPGRAAGGAATRTCDDARLLDLAQNLARGLGGSLGLRLGRSLGLGLSRSLGR